MEQVSGYRTDLIDESAQFIQQKRVSEETPGVVMEKWDEQRVKVTRVVVDPEGAEAIDKKAGTYVTLSIPKLVPEDEEGLQQFEKSLTKHLKTLHEPLKLKKDSRILIIGLGNRTITPDAVGPVTIDLLQRQFEEQRDMPFIMYAPGVTGQSGLETKEFIEALVQKIAPSIVIVIDALATRTTDRLCRTIQLTDTGIHPGSGVGNARTEVAYETLGVPVTAIGIPTVVEATVLLSDAIDHVFKSIAAKIAEQKLPSRKLSVTAWQPDEEAVIDYSLLRPIFGEWSAWPKVERMQLLQEVLHEQRFIVTPKECDIWLTAYAVLISTSLFKWANMF